MGHGRLSCAWTDGPTTINPAGRAEVSAFAVQRAWTRKLPVVTEVESELTLSLAVILQPYKRESSYSDDGLSDRNGLTCWRSSQTASRSLGLTLLANSSCRSLDPDCPALLLIVTASPRAYLTLKC